jgi:predicted enzyme involved in methoxymalonyl-ACP biosynthesis
LSCRVIGRGIEHLMLAFAAEHALSHGARTIVGEFFPTSRNAPAAGFYEAAGLERSGSGEYRATLPAEAFAAPDHIRLVAHS